MAGARARAGLRSKPKSPHHLEYPGASHGLLARRLGYIDVVPSHECPLARGGVVMLYAMDGVKEFQTTRYLTGTRQPLPPNPLSLSSTGRRRSRHTRLGLCGLVQIYVDVDGFFDLITTGEHTPSHSPVVRADSAVQRVQSSNCFVAAAEHGSMLEYWRRDHLPTSL